MTARLLTVGLLAALALGSLGGCAALDAALAPEPKVVTEEATIADPDAQVIGTVADGAPESLPLWPGARVEASKSVREAFTLVLVAQEPFDEVVNGVAVGLQRAGWEVAEEAGGDAGERVTVLTIGRAGASGFVTLAEGTDGTTIEYIVEPAP